jgi:hypothetical protein
LGVVKVERVGEWVASSWACFGETGSGRGEPETGWVRWEGRAGP